MEEVFTLRIRAAYPEGFCDNERPVDMRSPQPPFRNREACGNRHGAHRGAATSRPVE